MTRVPAGCLLYRGFCWGPDLQPLFYDLPEHGILFIATPKCATTSIMDALTPLLPATGARPAENPHQRWVGQKITQKQARALKPDRFIFAPVRNPWSRVVSHYKDKIVPHLHDRLAQYGFKKAMPFADYMKVVDAEYDRINDFHIIEQMRILTHKDTYLPDFTLKFERLGEDFDALCAMLRARTGVEITGLGRLNSRPSQSYTAYYDPPQLDVVERIYARDIQALNYAYPAA